MLDFVEYKVEVYVPEEYLETVVNAIRKVGTGKIGNYSNCLSWYLVRSAWHCGASAHPHLGTPGQDMEATEFKVEFRCKHTKLVDVVKAIRQAHPYEECCINVLPVLTDILCN